MCNKIYKKKTEIKIRNLGDKLLLYDSKRGLLIELNESARHIWSLLDSKPVNEIIEDYIKVYEIDSKIAQDDVMAVVHELMEKGIIE